VDDLTPKILLGNDFLSSYGANIDYSEKIVKFTALDFTASFEILTRSLPCNRKVTSVRKIILLLGQYAYLPVIYKPLPPDRSFSFEFEYATIVSAMVDSKTPKGIKAVNNTK
jgi:lysine/ornithine N-monooxygenase